ncbi:MAG: helix-turn-helix transcriptional regulator, partial [Vicinamibacteria bacterium]
RARDVRAAEREQDGRRRRLDLHGPVEVEAAVADATTVAAAALALHACDELARADVLLTAAIGRARAGGALMALATASCWRAVARWGQGRLAEASEDADHAAEAERHGWRGLLPAACGTVLGLLLDRGELDAAAAVGARAGAVGAGADGWAIAAPWHEALARLALAERRERDALAHLAAWRDAVEAIDNPACLAAWRSATAYALMGVGEPARARELAARELELARAFGAPRAICVALRALAHAEAHGDLAVPIARLEEAVALVAGSDARLEHARALLDLGAALRRAGRRSHAGRALGEALELARVCGARLVEERALEELEVAGTRVRRAARRGADALSPSERRVVALAIEGLSNRQIAEALFVTRKAVEWHLGNAYRKLDVRSRRELPDAIGGASDVL